MGRVARHKKLKAVDPFYEGPRKRVTDDLEGVTGPSADEDERIPRSLRTLMAAKRRAEDAVARKGKGVAKTAPTPRLKDAVKPKAGETLREFNDRVELNVREKLNAAIKDTKQTSQRRKEHLAARKAKAAAQRARRKEDEADTRPAGGDTVRFGEVVHAPPTLTVQPKRKTPKVGRAPLLLDAMLRASSSDGAGDKHASAPSAAVRPRDMAPSVRIKWEAQREQAIAAYRKLRGTERPAIGGAS